MGGMRYIKQGESKIPTWLKKNRRAKRMLYRKRGRNIVRKGRKIGKREEKMRGKWEKEWE